MSSAMTFQTVLYRTSTDALLASAQSIANAIKYAKSSGLFDEVTVAHGDASDAALDESVRQQIEQIMAQRGVTYSYSHFGFNSGSAAGQNLLAEAHPSDWHFVTNPDVVVGASAFEQLWRRTSDPSIGALESRQLPLELGKYYDPISGDTSWASGACSLIRGELWRSLGGYDAKTFFLYGDDVDMSWRIRSMGLRIVHVPTSRVFHDKRLGRDNGAISDLERTYSAVVSYLLAHKWGTDVDRERVMGFVAGEQYAAAREEIARLRRNDRLPAPVQNASRVAQFADDGTIGRWRYS